MALILYYLFLQQSHSHMFRVSVSATISHQPIILCPDEFLFYICASSKTKCFRLIAAVFWSLWLKLKTAATKLYLSLCPCELELKVAELTLAHISVGLIHPTFVLSVSLSYPVTAPCTNKSNFYLPQTFIQALTC